MSPRLLFVYNADSGLFNTLADVAHKLLSPATYPCNLCALTHTASGMREEWKRILGELPIPQEFLHRDQFRARFPELDVELPAVFRADASGVRLCLDAGTLRACPSLAALRVLLAGHCIGFS